MITKNNYDLIGHEPGQQVFSTLSDIKLQDSTKVVTEAIPFEKVHFCTEKVHIGT